MPGYKYAPLQKPASVDLVERESETETQNWVEDAQKIAIKNITGETI
jgi:hypothetical protein